MRIGLLVLFLTILLLAQHVAARGGGRTSGSRSSSSWGSRSYSRSSYGYGSNGYGGGLALPTWAIILIVCLLVFLGCCCCCCAVRSPSESIAVKKDSVRRRGSYITRTISYEGTIPCYLCLRKVRNSEWDSGEHRRECFFQNQRELLSYPKPYEAYCPECSEKLRLWPAKGYPFYCDECPYPQKERLKRSTGQNRLNCFLCDFDCCVSCSDAERFQKRMNTTSSGWNKPQIDALQTRFDQSMTPYISEEGVIPKNSSESTYSKDPPYNPSIAGPDRRTGSTYLSMPSGDQEVSTPFLKQQDTDLPPPAYPPTGYSANHYTTPANPLVPPSLHQELPYSISPYIQPYLGTNEQSLAPTAPSVVNKN